MLTQAMSVNITLFAHCFRALLATSVLEFMNKFIEYIYTEHSEQTVILIFISLIFSYNLLASIK